MAQLVLKILFRRQSQAEFNFSWTADRYDVLYKRRWKIDTRGINRRNRF
jgi:hypothetical protein